MLMQRLWTQIALISAALMFSAVEASALPKCTGSIGTWYECSGRHTFTTDWGFFSKGDTYSGEWGYGLPHGKGTLSWASGDKYVGEFKDGNLNGEGTFFLC